MAFLSDLSSFNLRKLNKTQTKSVNWGEVFAQDKDYWTKRSDVHSITENLFLTSYMGASNLELLEKNGITHVLVAASKLEQKFPHKFSYKQIHILDCPDQPIHHYFREVFEWIETAQKEEKGRVLVHCNAGISRSATFVIGYLMYSKRYTYDAAFSWVSERRTCVSPNHGFVEHLKNFEKNNFAFGGTSEVKEMKDCSPRHMAATLSSSSSSTSPTSPTSPSESESETPSEVRTEVPIVSLPPKSEAAKAKRREAEL